MTLNQIKQEIAALLNVDSVNAKSLFELANSNSVVLTAIQSIDASQFNLRTTETWQAILNKLKGEGVNESLGNHCGGDTVATVNQDETLDNENDLSDIEDFDYPDYAIDEVSKYYCLSLTNSISTTVTTDYSDNITEFKGIPVEHVTCDDIGLDYPETTSEVLVTTHQMPTVTYFLVDNSEDVLQFNSLSSAVKQINKWLGVKQQQVPSVKQLTPKLELFSAMTEFVFLMECLSKLLKMFADSEDKPITIEDKPITIKVSGNLFKLWWNVCSICCGGYVHMPHISYIKLLD